ncbi:hypothetical protein HDV05_002225 [Chytridiales sp. JEL 0842]|nr:hypothetical protein HDV05_002225 [Chytridiales sp. JEL 0842]
MTYSDVLAPYAEEVKRASDFPSTVVALTELCRVYKLIESEFVDTFNEHHEDLGLPFDVSYEALSLSLISPEFMSYTYDYFISKFWDSMSSYEDIGRLQGDIIITNCYILMQSSSGIIRALHGATPKDSGALTLDELCHQVKTIGLMDFVQSIVIEMIYEHVENGIVATAGSNYSHRVKDYIEWSHSTIIPWVLKVLNHDMPSDQKQIISRIDYFIYKNYCTLRSKELFEIIMGFPASAPAVVDLKARVLTDHRPARTIAKLIRFNLRATSITSGGNLIGHISKNVKRYLRGRSDAIKCTIEILTGSANDVDEDLLSYEAPSEFGDSPHMRKNELLRHVLNLFDSTDDFVREFQTILANNLLSADSFETDKEIEHLEMLKQFLPETKLNTIEVMIKDISDSKRIATNIKQLHYQNEEEIVTPKILSRLFWPNFSNESCVIPEELNRVLERYQTAYKTVKSARKLKWLLTYGSMDLELELQDRILSVTGTPLQCSVLFHFTNNDTWDVKELSKLMPIGNAVLERILLYWVQKGVLKKLPTNEYCVKERADDTEEHEDGAMDFEEESEQVQEADSSADMRVFWPFISGMLTNLGALPVERIQMMLTQFVQTPKYTKTTDELRRFLDRLVLEDALETHSFLYSIKK